MTQNILVADDEKSIRDSIKLILEYQKYTVLFAENGEQALKIVQEFPVDAVLLDIKMPGLDGIEVLRRIRETAPALPVIMISGHGTFETAVEATKIGAFDYLPKPLDRDKLLITLRNALQQKSLSRELEGLRERERILGESLKIKEILSVIARVGPTDSRVLVTGESGTGKELVARALHRSSKRAALPFVEVNCAAIPAELIESELFGHEKGSFTGATAQRIGKFEQADTGTIFLDEIGDMSLQAQAKVLRALEEGKLERVGGNRLIPVDVRVIAATNKDLPKEMKKGTFREDLYHRLNVIRIALPPLRDRKEDIPLMARAFTDEICARNGFAKKLVSERAMSELLALPWSGNVRELKNTVERLVIMTPGGVIERASIETQPEGGAGEIESILLSSGTFQEYKDRAEALFIRHQLEVHNWNVSKTAEALQMERSHLYTKIKKYALERRPDAGEDGQ